MKRVVGSLVELYALFALVSGVLRGLRAAEKVARRSRAEPQVWPFASVIVPAWRDCAALETCLFSLGRVDYPDYEVIVVAGGPDGTYEAAVAAARQDDRIQVIEQLPRGKNAALNQGLAHASADVLVFLDADSELTPQWLKALVGALQGDIAASTGNYVPLGDSAVSLHGEVAKVSEYQVRNRVILQGSGGIALRREALEDIGPFPEERVSSDWDLDARVSLHGYRKAFAPDAVIRSHRPTTLREWWWNELRWRRLHLRSLFRLKETLSGDPASTARHLYPYVTSWLVVLLTAVAAASLSLKPGRLKEPILLSWFAFASLLFMREMSPVVSVMAFQPSTRWLSVIPINPVMTAMTWVACCIASVTSNKATLQFKGPRTPPLRQK